jgi:hypothetical protein
MSLQTWQRQNRFWVFIVFTAMLTIPARYKGLVILQRAPDLSPDCWCHILPVEE